MNTQHSSTSNRSIFLTLGALALGGAGFWLWQSNRSAPPASPKVAALAPKGLAKARPKTIPAAPKDVQPEKSPAKAPKVAAQEKKPNTGSGQVVLARLGYGSGENQVGRDEPNEANPEGVASLTLTADGKIVVLDKVNGRLLSLDKDGSPLGSTALKLASPQEIVAQKDGSLLVMDRLVDKSIMRLDPSGEPAGTIAIEGKEIEHGGSVTGLFADDEGIYVEHEHGKVVRVADADGKPDPKRPTLSGRPSKDGDTLVTAHLRRPADGEVFVRSVDRKEGSLKKQRKVSFDQTVFSVEFLETDRSGKVYLGAHVGSERDDGKILSESIKVVCLDKDLQYQGKATLPASQVADESFRRFSVDDNGDIFYMNQKEDGVSIEKYRCS